MKNCRFKTLTFFVAATMLFLIGCRANPPSRVEKKVVQESKDLVIGGKDWHNPVPRMLLVSSWEANTSSITVRSVTALMATQRV
jgi:hypothetical protein